MMNGQPAIDKIPIDTNPAPLPDFLVPKKWVDLIGTEKERIIKKSKHNTFEFYENEQREESEQWLGSYLENKSGAAPPKADNNRLVINRKSPTRGAVARIYARDWAKQTRVRIEAGTRYKPTLNPNMGERWTEALSDGSTQKILDAGAYVAVKRGGFSTFLTLTFDRLARQRITKIRSFPVMGKKGEEVSEDIKAAGEFCRVGCAGDFCSGTKADARFTPVELTTESTIGREVSRFFDAANKMYSRGWQWQPVENQTLLSYLPIQQRIPGYGVNHCEHGPQLPQKLDYVWVAENPDSWDVLHSDAGPVRTKYRVRHSKFGPVRLSSRNTNPHCHILMRWDVPHWQFAGWAKRLEQIWGQGFAHLEKIKNPSAAGAYLLKAAGYLTKSDGQGRIRGNRYNISKPARAPGWECLAEFEAEQMSQVLYQNNEFLQRERDKLNEQIAEEKQGLKAAIGKLAVFKNINTALDRQWQSKISLMEKRIKRAEQTIDQLYKDKAATPIPGKYQTIFSKVEQLQSLLGRAVEHGWTANPVGRVTDAAKQACEWAQDTGRKLWRKIQFAREDNEFYWHQLIIDSEPYLNDWTPVTNI